MTPEPLNFTDEEKRFIIIATKWYCRELKDGNCAHRMVELGLGVADKIERSVER